MSDSDFSEKQKHKISKNGEKRKESNEQYHFPTAKPHSGNRQPSKRISAGPKFILTFCLYSHTLGCNKLERLSGQLFQHKDTWRDFKSCDTQHDDT
jgi:hypothetical protein